MPFKIVETFEKGKNLLFTVPSLWESKGVLRWPKNRPDINNLVRDENCSPSKGWTTSRCRVKRQSISSFAEAERELSLMLSTSDTETDEGSEIQNNTVKSSIDHKNNENYNALAELLIFKKPAEPSLSRPSTSSAPSNIIESLDPDTDIDTVTDTTKYLIEYLDESHMQTNPVNMETNELETPRKSHKNTDNNQITEYLKQILNNQHNIEQKINILECNQKKIFQKLASLSVQMDDGFTMQVQDSNSTGNVVTLSESKSAKSFDNEAFIIKPIASILDLEKVESLLSDKNNKKLFLAQYSFVCSRSDGKGVTSAYKMLDMFFTRDFLCKCSWTGGSRKSEEVKIGLKKYKNVLNAFYELIRSWDRTFTLQDNENFFKTVLKNSGKRRLNKGERASTKRVRTKKDAIKNGSPQKDLNESVQENQNAGDQEEIQNNMETNEGSTNDNITEDAEINEYEEEEEESLC